LCGRRWRVPKFLGAFEIPTLPGADCV